MRARGMHQDDLARCRVSVGACRWLVQDLRISPGSWVPHSRSGPTQGKVHHAQTTRSSDNQRETINWNNGTLNHGYYSFVSASCSLIAAILWSRRESMRLFPSFEVHDGVTTVERHTTPACTANPIQNLGSPLLLPLYSIRPYVRSKWRWASPCLLFSIPGQSFREIIVRFRIRPPSNATTNSKSKPNKTCLAELLRPTCPCWPPNSLNPSLRTCVCVPIILEIRSHFFSWGPGPWRRRR